MCRPEIELYVIRVKSHTHTRARARTRTHTLIHSVVQVATCWEVNFSPLSFGHCFQWTRLEALLAHSVPGSGCRGHQASAPRSRSGACRCPPRPRAPSSPGSGLPPPPEPSGSAGRPSGRAPAPAPVVTGPSPTPRLSSPCRGPRDDIKPSRVLQGNLPLRILTRVGHVPCAVEGDGRSSGA